MSDKSVSNEVDLVLRHQCRRYKLRRMFSSSLNELPPTEGVFGVADVKIYRKGITVVVSEDVDNAETKNEMEVTDEVAVFAIFFQFRVVVLS